MRTIDSINFSNKKAIIRVDFNVPLNDQFQIMDDSRLKATLPTLNKILNEGGAIILMSHLGRPKIGPEDRFSLSHIVNQLSHLLNRPVQFANDCIGSEAIDKASNLQSGEVLLLENLRFYSEETKGDSAFAKKLASLADVYVNDAFGTAHRAHASTAIIAQNFAEKALGYVMAREVENAKKVMDNPQRPFTAIVGGAKVSDKILIIENLMSIADNIIVGGGMAFTFFKAMGGTIGSSLCEDDRIQDCKNILESAKAKGVNILLPEDSMCTTAFSNDTETMVCATNEIQDGWMGLDIGPKAIDFFSKTLVESKTILWNGPMGVFEMSNFSKGTSSVAESVVFSTEKGAFSLIGGGDSAAAVHQLGFSDRVSYISTGGGALLEFFEGKPLPGIETIAG
jgi:phosphoglycerate kinase